MKRLYRYHYQSMSIFQKQLEGIRDQKSQIAETESLQEFLTDKRLLHEFIKVIQVNEGHSHIYKRVVPHEAKEQ